MPRKHKADCTPEEWAAIRAKQNQYYADHPEYAEKARQAARDKYTTHPHDRLTPEEKKSLDAAFEK